MNKTIRILILEHDKYDLELLQYELNKSGLNYISEVVQTKTDYERAIADFKPDIILSDYSLPTFNGLSAFKIKNEISPETPFIFVSGTIGDENAVELIKTGATDYALKEKMYQIVPKILRGLNEAKERKLKNIAEKNLEQSRQELQKIMDLSADLICVTDQEGNLLNVSNSSKDILGYASEELIGRQIWEMIYPDDLEHTLSVAFQPLTDNTLKSYENRYIRKDGTIVHLLWSARIDPSTNLAYCNAKDITEIKAKEAQLELSEARLKEAQVLGKLGNWEIDFADGSAIWSDEMYNIHHVDRESFTPSFDSFNSLIHPEDQHFVSRKIKIAVATIKDGYLKYRFVKSNGEQRYAYTKWNFIFDAAGRPNAIFGITQDVTESKLAEIALEKSERKYRNMFHASPIPMWVFDGETLKFRDINEAAIMHYGYSKEEFLAMTIKDIRPYEELIKLEQAVEFSRNHGGFFQGDAKHIKKSGEIIIVNIKCNNIYNEEHTEYLVLATDVTERYKYLHAIEDQNKKLMEIAWIQGHKVRAPLARLMGLVSYLKTYASDDEESKQLLEYIMVSANALDDIIREISSKTEPILDLAIPENPGSDHVY